MMQKPLAEHKFPCYRYFEGFICVYFKISQENLVSMNIICETVIKWNLTVTQLKLTVTYRKTWKKEILVVYKIRYGIKIGT